MKAILRAAQVLPILLGLAGCAASEPAHGLVGSWKATDGTVFIFREDGTFIGRDYVNRRIFGNWVALDQSRIGFQTLMHTRSYAPQYAEITDDGMRYAYSDGSRFVSAVKADPEEALRETAEASLDQSDVRPFSRYQLLGP